MNFQLSPEVDKNKIFLVNLSELEGRLDANTYHPQRTIAIKKIRETPYGTNKLGLITSFSKKIVTSIFDSDIYIGLENIERSTGTFIEYDKKQSISSAVIFKKGQVLFPKLRPYLNKVFHAKFDGICSTEFHVLDSDRLDNKYLAIFLSLDIVVLQTSLLMSGNTLPRLQTEDIKNLLIPIPPKEIQTQIVAKMDAAYATKKQKEAEAQRLLDGIDGYLLGELGIELPKQTENTLQNRIFTRQLSEVSGGRFDPIFYSCGLNKFSSRKYKSLKIKDVATRIISGIGAGKQEQSNEIDKLIQIRPTNIDRNGNLKYDKNIFLSRSFQGEKINFNDILFNNTNSQELVGKTSILKDKKELFFSNHITKIEVDDNKIIPDYLSIILNIYQRNNIFYSICTNWNNQSGVGLILLKSLKIPLPPLEKQTEISNHITAIRNQAKELQKQAKTGLEQAKKEVEAMILGEDDSTKQ